MADVTINQLAKVLDMPSDKLLSQLGKAGMEFSAADEVVSNDEKSKLLEFLRRNHGRGEAGEAKNAGPSQVTLRRRKRSELKVSSGSGRSTTSKTVNVEVRARRTYVKRGDMTADAEATQEREDARRKLQESQEKREREQNERAERERQREDIKRQEAEAKVAEEEARRAAEAEQAQAEASDNETVTETQDDQSAAEGADQSAWATPVMPRLHEPRKRREKPAAKDIEAAKPAEEIPSRSGHGSRRDRDRERERERNEEGRGRKRFGAGKLHLTETERARRGSGRRRRMDTPRQMPGSGQHGFSKPTAPVVREVAVGEANVIGDLAQKMAVKGAEVVKALFNMGVMATINQTIDHDTGVLVVEELGHKPVDAEQRTAETTLLAQTASADEEGTREARPPVVTIMGHVDHGKTSLLDHIRRTKVATGEAGGITQHIGAYHVTTDKGVITFLDTPGHAAFTSMRARGAQATDIVVLVVAADDGVKPQTVEAIEHARAAKVPLIVAINKVDKADANIDNVKQGLAGQEVVPEDWGGDVQFVPVSAKTGQGIDELLDAISLQSELMELDAVVDGRASGTVIEARLERGRGPVATVLVQQGTLSKGDFVVCGVEYGRMRALIDENGKQVDHAGPSIAVQVLGLSSVPSAGDDFVVVADEKLAKQVAEERAQRRRETRLVAPANRLEDIMAQMGKGEAQQVLNILIKADVQGSAEALRESLGQIGNDMVKVNVVASGVGGITESDATLASASKALLIGFNVRADASARKVVETNGVDLRYFSIIYDVIDQVTQAASGLLGNEVRENIIGIAEVREVFRSSKFGAVAGCMVAEGVVRRNKPIRVLRENTVVFEGELESLRRHKDDVEEVHAGTECGIAVKQYNDVHAGDQIECFERVEVARTL